MKLPSHIIQQVKWFEHYRKPTVNSYGDLFILHFQQWWKLRRTIVLEGDYTRTVDGIRLYEQSDDATELLAQLKAQCPDQA